MSLTTTPHSVPDVPVPGPSHGDVAFHRVERPRWRATVELVVLVVLYLAFSFGTLLLLAFTGVALGLPETIMELEGTDLDANVLMLISLAMTCAAPLLAARISGRHPSELLSVSGRFRWRHALAPALIAVAGYSFSTLIHAAAGAYDSPSVTGRGLAFIALCAFLVPLQSATEELIFRAAIPQIVGTWLRSPIIAYGAAVPFFVIGHDYNWIGLAGILVFAVCAAVLTHATGGIEASTALHAIGNFFAFVGLGLGIADPSRFDVSPTSAFFDIAMTVALTAAILWAVPLRGIGIGGASRSECAYVPNRTRRG